MAAVLALATAAAGLSLRFGVGGLGKEFLATMFAAKIECISIADCVDRGGLVNGHPTDRVFGCFDGVGHRSVISS